MGNHKNHNNGCEDTEDHLGKYLREAGATPLLTPEEEFNLGDSIKRTRHKLYHLFFENPFFASQINEIYKQIYEGDLSYQRVIRAKMKKDIAYPRARKDFYEINYPIFEHHYDLIKRYMSNGCSEKNERNTFSVESEIGRAKKGCLMIFCEYPIKDWISVILSVREQASIIRDLWYEVLSGKEVFNQRPPDIIENDSHSLIYSRWIESGMFSLDKINRSTLEEKLHADSMRGSLEDFVRTSEEMDVGLSDYWRLRNEIAKANLRLVIKLAKKIARKIGRDNVMDFILSGNEGLMRAIETWDPMKGRFTTYASWWIQKGIYEEDRFQRFPISISRDDMKAIKNLREFINEYYSLHDFNPSSEDISLGTGLSHNEISKIRNLNRTVNLSENIGDGNVISDFISVDGGDNGRNNGRDVLEIDKLYEALDSLEERERRIIVLYYGLEDGKQRTSKEISEIFKLSREWIRQIKKGAEEQLKELLSKSVKKNISSV